MQGLTAVAGSRQIHLSLTIPTVDQVELSEPVTSSVNVAIGTLVGAAPGSSVAVRSTAWDRAAGALAIRRPVAPIVGPTDSSENVRQGDDAD